MKLLILGSGLMGPAAAFNAASQPDVAQVVLCDLDQQQLELAIRRFVGTEVAAKLGVVRLDLSHQEAAAQLMAKFDAVVAALPRTASPLGIRAALQAGVPLVDLTRPNEDEVKALKQAAHAAGGLIILGCGVEPGLTEILARHLAEKLDRVDELHIKCGGIPAEPAPPLGYKIVFGGRQLPLREQDGHVVEAGELKLAPRYSAVERVVFDGVGECEAWQENFLPWLLGLSAFKGLKNGTQKTIRWPGYAAKVRVLKELGLLNQEPVEVDGVSVVPKHLVDAVRASEEDPDALPGLLNRLPARPGDVYLIPARVAHAIGAGCLILEVQVEDEDKGTKGIQHSLEVEIKWFDDEQEGPLELG